MKAVFFPLQAHCFAYGGFEIQMLAAHNAIKGFPKHVEVSLINPWEKDSQFDISHFWGLEISNYGNIYWSKRSGKAVVLTALLGYFDSYSQVIKHYLSKYVGVNKARFKMLQFIDVLVVVNEIQKRNAIRFYGVSEYKVFVVPNIVNAKYFQNKVSSNFKSPFQNFILSVGNICRRKNQLLLVKACLEARINLILVGKILTGEDDYAQEIEELTFNKSNIIWIKGLKEDSDELVGMVKSCSAVALISNEETQPISLLEAAVCQKPIIIAKKSYANQKYYSNAYKVNNNSKDELINACRAVLSEPAKYITPLNILEECKETSVAESYIEIYKKILYDKL